MNPKDIWILYRRELRSALRERTIVVNSILIPILLYPLLMWLLYTGITFVSGLNEGLPSRVALTGLPGEHAALRNKLQSLPDITLVESGNPQEDIRSGAIDAVAAFDTSDAVRVQITYDESRDRSARANRRISEAIGKYREDILESEAGRLGISAETFQGFWIEDVDVSTGVEQGRFVLGLLLPMILIVMLAVGGMYPAIDSTAGERENSTWETLMTLATSRTNIVAAKYLYVATMSFVAGALNVIAMVVSMQTILAPLGQSASRAISFQVPIDSIPVLILGAALLALFLAACMMILASFARTFKEGQSMVSPFYIAIVAPIMFMTGSAPEFTLQTAMIPVLNVTMMFREAIVGTYNWNLIGITILVEAATVVLALKLSVTILKYEDFVMGSHGGSFGKFLKARLLK